MNLLNEDIQKLWKSPQSRKQITESIAHHQRLSFHVDTAVSRLQCSPYSYLFLQWVGAMLPDDKYKRFEQLFPYPVLTNELTQSIFKELRKVFNAQDFYEDYKFVNEKYADDFRSYKESKRLDDFWRTQGFEMMKTSIDCYVVVDLPSRQSGKYPEPYYFFLQPEDVKDVSVNVDNVCEYIMFEAGGKIMVYDDSYYRVYAKVKGSISQQPDVEILHGLGYCPARTFWSDTTGYNNINKLSPITGSLSNLDWLLYFEVAKRYLDLYAAYPIYVSYSGEVDPMSDDKNTADQNRANKGDLIGPGSYWTVPPPQGQGEPDLLQNPIQVIGAQVDSLNYCVAETRRLNELIFNKCVGAGDKMENGQAKNELQVQGAFESKETVLAGIAENFANVIQWANSTVARLRYGIYFTSATVNFGTRFYLYTVGEMVEELSGIKDKGGDPTLVNHMKKQISSLMYRNDPTGKQKAEIVEALDPYPDLTIKEASEMIDKGTESEEVMFKIRLPYLIAKFEREEGSIIEYMARSPFNIKINSIHEKLESYDENDDGERTGDVRTARNGIETLSPEGDQEDND